MQEELAHALHARRPQIRERWEALLRVERACSPLAHPDSLVHLVNWALDEVIAILRQADSGAAPVLDPAEECLCGRNPYAGFFRAGEQSIMEALILVQVEHAASLNPKDRDRAAAELAAALRGIRNREVSSFCSLCQHRPALEARAASARAV